MLSLENVSKHYKKAVIFEDLNTVFDVGVHLVLGESGAGKSTLLRLCATQEKASSGEITWNGKSLTKNLRAYRQILGYAPQKIDFPEDLTGLDFMVHMGALKGISYKETKAQSTTLLSRLGVGDAANKPIAAWSGGMCRRLGLAQAFLGKPQCLVIDEPTAELDSVTAASVNELIFESAQDCVVIMTTHLEHALSDYRYKTLTIEKRVSE